MWISMCISFLYLVNNSIFINCLFTLEDYYKYNKVYKNNLYRCYSILNHIIYTYKNLSFIVLLKQNVGVSTLSTNTITITIKKNI